MTLPSAAVPVAEQADAEVTTPTVRLEMALSAIDGVVAAARDDI